MGGSVRNAELIEKARQEDYGVAKPKVVVVMGCNDEYGCRWRYLTVLSGYSFRLDFGSL